MAAAAACGGCRRLVLPSPPFAPRPTALPARYNENPIARFNRFPTRKHSPLLLGEVIVLVQAILSLFRLFRHPGRPCAARRGCEVSRRLSVDVCARACSCVVRVGEATAAAIAKSRRRNGGRRKSVLGVRGDGAWPMQPFLSTAFQKLGKLLKCVCGLACVAKLLCLRRPLCFLRVS